MATLPLHHEQAGTERSPRLGVLWVPDWPVVAAMTEQGITADIPLAVHDAQSIIAASAPARALGIRRGMRRRVAQELCPELILVPADSGRDVRTFEQVVQACEDVVAELEVVRPGMMLFAAAGPSRYLGSEEKLADSLVGAVAQQAGAECQVGIAEGYLTAVLAARDGVSVPAGTSPSYLATRDIRSLLHAATTREASASWVDLVDLLRRLGIHTLGAFAALRGADVAARFGDLGVQGHRLARGLDARRPVVHRPDPDISVRADLDPPAARIDTAAFVARRLAEDLHNRLLRRGAVCARLAVAARTTTGSELTRTWRIEGALTASELTDRVRWQLEGWLGGRSGAVPSAPLARLEITAQEVAAAGASQDGLWGRRSRGEEQAARAALRVQGLLGPERVLVPVPEGGRTPRERLRLVAWGDEASPSRSADAPWPGQIPPPLPTIVPLTPPRIDLLGPDGTQVKVDSSAQLTAPPHTLNLRELSSVTHLGWLRPGTYRIRTWAGPWPITQRWWSVGGNTGAWLQIEVERQGGAVVLVTFHDGYWWVEGVHD